MSGSEEDDEMMEDLLDKLHSDVDAADQAAGPPPVVTSDSDVPADHRLQTDAETLHGGSSSSDDPRQKRQPKQDRTGPAITSEEKWYSGNPPSWLQASWFQGFDGDLSGLWMALKASLNDAKDAQAEAVAAWREVSEAREKEAALSVHKKQKVKAPGSTLSGGERATAKGLRARNETLRMAVQEAKRTLKEERRQNQRVLAELQRLEQRAQMHGGDVEGLNAALEGTGYPGSPQSVLPGIGRQSPPALGNSKPQTPRDVGSARTPNRKPGQTPRSGEGASPGKQRPNSGAAPLPKIAAPLV
eukprot:gnl/MRDRNA2_/MRDRNA2_98032_c0_seq1.p1 gnl/MRDRNA2_/MRDRNA2_98032_c0~~gnl/MRDRNA2_/MRDRNA2_98032_c0_seq1.p1  ORF type:complete len:328 (+),score=96.49 gnl/MRDRNA2_/MRDRNA2_98032_c0_seq1:82-984(+)